MRSVPSSIQRQKLIAVLEGDSATETRAAVDALRSGAAFTYYESEPFPGQYLVETYQRRAEWCRHIGLDARGFDLAIERFNAAGECGSTAHIQGEYRVYIVFMTPHAASVVACLSLPASDDLGRPKSPA
jgi:hypothetical protein